MKRCGLCLVVCLFLLVSVCSTTSARTWYIKVDGTGDAPTIQAGCDLAQHGDTVLVGPGTYTISAQGSNQYGMISILRGSADMTIVGEAGAGATILDGQFQNRIFFFQGETELTVDGFTFTAGEAPLTGSFTGGAFAAHFSSPVMKNCVFINNSANDGGAYWYGGFGTPLILDCVFIGNSGVNGGAMYLINSPGNVVVSNCLFEDNTASNDGGAIWTYNFRVSIEGCVFDHNSAAVDGGAVAVNNSYPIPIMSTTFYQNSAANGGAVAVTGASPVTIDQSIIASGLGGAATYVDATSTLTCGCTDIWGNNGGDWTGAIAGQLGSNGNFSSDPRFCSTGSADYMLQSGSPCSQGNHPDGASCGTIGAFAVGCGTVDVRIRTWGAIKSIYAD
jgi:predicted outer membrane repeat protein